MLAFQRRRAASEVNLRNLLRERTAVEGGKVPKPSPFLLSLRDRTALTRLTTAHFPIPLFKVFFFFLSFSEMGFFFFKYEKCLLVDVKCTSPVMEATYSFLFSVFFPTLILSFLGWFYD